MENKQNELLPKFESEAKELKKITNTKGMEKLFNTLKENGLFLGYKNYRDWLEAKEILKDKMSIRDGE